MKNVDLIVKEAADYIDSLVRQYAKEPASETKEEIEWVIRRAIHEAKANVTELEAELVTLLSKRGYGCLSPGTFVTESAENTAAEKPKIYLDPPLGVNWEEYAGLSKPTRGDSAPG